MAKVALGSDVTVAATAAAAAMPRLARAFLAVAGWGEALQGRGELRQALAALRDAVGAEMATLVQLSPGGPRDVHLISADRDDPGDRRGLPAEVLRPLARAGIDRGRPGSVWRYSEILGGLLVAPGREVAQWFRSRRIAEVCCLVLSGGRDGAHLLNLFFARPPGPETLALLEALAPALAAGWDGRDLSVVAATRRAGLALVAPEPEDQPLLGLGNPAGLTRAEFRVCTLLSEGHAARDLPSELGISESTLRSHLRSIYAKTGTAGLAGLIHRLLAAPLPSRRPA